MAEQISKKELHNPQLRKTGTPFEKISLYRTERFLRGFPEIQREHQGQIQWVAENPQRPRNIWLRGVKISWFGAQGRRGDKLVLQGKAENVEFMIGSIRNYMKQEKEEERKRKRARKILVVREETGSR